MEQDLIEAKAYLSQQGYGTGTNYTTNLVTVLLANYAEMQLKKLRVADVRHSSLLAINFAFQNTINCGELTWRLTETDLEEIRNLVEPNDNEKTGSQLWKWFYEKWDKKFITGQKMEYIGAEFMRNLSRYCA